MKNQNIYHLRNNLRQLISECSSVTSAASALGMNRQQLSKYLSGVSTPSLRTLQNISIYFNVTTESMFLSSKEFEAARRVGALPQTLSPEISGELSRAIGYSGMHQDKLKDYCGVYHILARPPLIKGAVCRFLLKIYQKDNFTIATRIETYVPLKSVFLDSRSMRKFHSILTFSFGKLVMVSSFSTSRITFSIIYPDAFAEYGFLQGNMLFSYDAGARGIYSGPFILNKLRIGRIQRGDIASCGVFSIDDPAISDIERALMMELEYG